MIGDNNMKLNVYMKGRNGSYDAKGIYTGSTLIVLKGSLIKDKNFVNRMDISKEIRKDNKLFKSNRLLEDITLNSPSTAANFVADAICNGLRYWKTEKGLTLKEYLDNIK